MFIRGLGWNACPARYGAWGGSKRRAPQEWMRIFAIVLVIAPVSLSAEIGRADQGGGSDFLSEDDRRIIAHEYLPKSEFDKPIPRLFCRASSSIRMVSMPDGYEAICLIVVERRQTPARVLVELGALEERFGAGESVVYRVVQDTGHGSRDRFSARKRVKAGSAAVMTSHMAAARNEAGAHARARASARNSSGEPSMARAGGVIQTGRSKLTVHSHCSATGAESLSASALSRMSVARDGASDATRSTGIGSLVTLCGPKPAGSATGTEMRQHRGTVPPGP